MLIFWIATILLVLFIIGISISVFSNPDYHDDDSSNDPYN